MPSGQEVGWNLLVSPISGAIRNPAAGGLHPGQYALGFLSLIVRSSRACVAEGYELKKLNDAA
jgi:hypothetical protein